MAIQLTKNNPINLTKDNPGLTSFTVGLGWDPAKGGRSIDLDSSIFCVDSNGRVVDTVYYGDLTAPGIRHHGDNRTGAGDGPDEMISVDLTKIPNGIAKLVVTINSFTGQTFGQVDREFMQISSNNKILVNYTPDHDSNSTNAKSLVVANVVRESSEWKLEAVGTYYAASSLNDLKVIIQK
jgi:stress response protein SCP2